MKCGQKDVRQNIEFRWKKCQWTRLYDGSSCQFWHMKVGQTNVWEVHQVCNGSLDLQFSDSQTFNTAKGNNICGVVFKSILKSDEGQWLCSVTYQDEVHDLSCIAKSLIYAKVNKKVNRNE